MIVPEIAGGAAGELDDLRAACDAAVAGLAASDARTLVVVGGDAVTREYPLPFRGDFARWGAPVGVAIGGAAPRPDQAVPLSLLVGAWLVQRSFAVAPRPVAYRLVGLRDPAAAERFGSTVRSDEPWALLAMGDGSACRGAAAPGYDDPRAGPYDTAVARALTGADADALLGLDTDLSAQLKVAGRASWPALAAAVRATGRPWRGRLSYDAAPYGVAYFVASWEPT